MLPKVIKKKDREERKPDPDVVKAKREVEELPVRYLALNKEEDFEVLSDLFGKFSKVFGQNVAITGGVAVNLWCRPEFQRIASDVDLMVNHRPTKEEIAKLEELGIKLLIDQTGVMVFDYKKTGWGYLKVDVQFRERVFGFEEGL